MLDGGKIWGKPPALGIKIVMSVLVFLLLCFPGICPRSAWRVFWCVWGYKLGILLISKSFFFFSSSIVFSQVMNKPLVFLLHLCSVNILWRYFTYWGLSKWFIPTLAALILNTGCPGFDWGRINFLSIIWYRVMFWI